MPSNIYMAPICQEKKIQLEWKEPFQFKKWKLKKEIEQYGKWRYISAYLIVFIGISTLSAATFMILNTYLLHEEIILSKIIGRSLFLGFIVCFLFYYIAFDTTKVKLGNNGILYFHGGEWTEYRYSKINEYNIEKLNDSGSVKALKLQLDTGDEVRFGINSKIRPEIIVDILNTYIETTTQGHIL